LIQAAAFDYGKVISFPPGPETVKQLAALAGIPAEVFEPLLWEHREDYDRGIVDGLAYYRGFLGLAGVHPGEETLREMLRIDLDSWKRVNPGTVRLMEEIKGAGLKLGILSNMPHDFLAYGRASLPVFRLPDAGVFSCELRSVKPEAAIYRALLAALGTEPGETVFFDDMERNVEKAAELGFRAFLWESPAAARGELRRLGVRV
jgi:putative hydrolase of the HAD superfamily